MSENHGCFAEGILQAAEPPPLGRIWESIGSSAAPAPTILPAAQSSSRKNWLQTREEQIQGEKEANEDMRGMQHSWWCGCVNSRGSISSSGQAQRWKLSKGNLSKALDSSKKHDKKLAKRFSAVLKDQGERSLCWQPRNKDRISWNREWSCANPSSQLWTEEITIITL